jgi:hypothetical protein
MTMKVQYVAEDGAIFDTEIACVTHETRTAFGSDARFVNSVDETLASLVSEDDRGNAVIYFGDDDDKIQVATAIASHFGSLSNAYEIILAKFNKDTRPAKKKKVRA